jgi:hypothetical protein
MLHLLFVGFIDFFVGDLTFECGSENLVFGKEERGEPGAVMHQKSSSEVGGL